jgi:hypothetical protein
MGGHRHVYHTPNDIIDNRPMYISDISKSITVPEDKNFKAFNTFRRRSARQNNLLHYTDCKEKLHLQRGKGKDRGEVLDRMKYFVLTFLSTLKNISLQCVTHGNFRPLSKSALKQGYSTAQEHL